MNKYFKMLAIATIFILVFTCGMNVCADASAPVVTNGILDLTNWDFDRNTPLKLNGEWEFYWNQLVEPMDFIKDLSISKGARLIRVPKYWNKGGEGIKYNAFGYATYRLIIKTKPESRLLALRIPRILTAYKLWINGEPMASCGIVKASLCLLL